jgi:hypothetical protein
LKLLQRVLISICLVIILGLPLACSSPSGSENSSTPGKSTTKSTIKKLMGLLPVSAMQSENETISFMDFAKIREINGFSFPSSCSEEGLTNYSNALGKDGVNELSGTFHSGGSRYVLQTPIKPENVGYGLANVDAEIASTFPPYLIEVLAGSFNPSTTKDVFAKQENWAQFAKANFTTEVYKGVSVYSWGDGFEMHLMERLIPPCVDNLGRARPMAVTDSNVFVSHSIENVKSMIDLSTSKTSGLTSLQQYADIADGLTELDVFRASISQPPTKVDNGPQDMSNSPLLKKYIAYAEGWGKDDKGTYRAIAIANPDKTVAAENEKILKTRIENVSYVDQENAPVLVKSYLREYTVYSTGRLVLVKMYAKDSDWGPNTSYLLFQLE